MKLGRISIILIFFYISILIDINAEDKILTAPIINLEELQPSYENLEIEGEEGQFEYLIDYGKKSGCLPENDKNENHLMSGCLAKVWLKTYKKNDKNYFEGDSDALIVKGLVKIIAEAFSGLTTEEIKNVRH